MVARYWDCAANYNGQQAILKLFRILWAIGYKLKESLPKGEVMK